MEVGLVQAIKTLTDDFRPLDEVYREFVDEAVLAEELGFDFVSESEHHLQDDAWSPSPLTVLTFIAARTSRVRLHTNILILPLHNPLRISEDVAALDILSNGRVDLVCGSGSVRTEFDTFGIKPETRWTRMFEGMDLIRRSYTEDRFDYDGKYVRFSNIHQTTKPVQQPFPLWVGGVGPKLMRRAGQMGFHAQMTPNFHPEYLEGLKDAGLSPDDMNLAMFLTAYVAHSKEQAWEECKVGWWNWQNEYRKRDTMFPMPPLPDLAEMAHPPTLQETMFAPVLGNPDDILRTLEPVLKDSDCTHFSLDLRASGGNLPKDSVREGMRLFAKEVLPVLRTWGRRPKTSVAR